MGAAEGGGVLGVESSAESGSWIFWGRKVVKRKSLPNGDGKDGSNTEDGRNWTIETETLLFLNPVNMFSL